LLLNNYKTGGKMKVICSWCGHLIGEKEPLKNEEISHTICEGCRKEYFHKEVKNKDDNN
jgi:hypothetical protein